MPNKIVRVQVRIDPELRTRLDNAVKSTGVPEAVIVVRCIEAFCAYVEERGEITLPLIVKPASADSSAQQPKRKTA